MRMMNISVLFEKMGEDERMSEGKRKEK